MKASVGITRCQYQGYTWYTHPLWYTHPGISSPPPLWFTGLLCYTSGILPPLVYPPPPCWYTHSLQQAYPTLSIQPLVSPTPRVPRPLEGTWYQGYSPPRTLLAGSKNSVSVLDRPGEMISVPAPLPQILMKYAPSWHSKSEMPFSRNPRGTLSLSSGSEGEGL